MKKKKNQKACVIIIGNEILSGRTIDTNKNYLCKELTSNGIDVIEARVIKDNEKQIINTIKQVRKKFNYIFTTGGIGPTHDDITSLSIAKGESAAICIDSCLPSSDNSLFCFLLFKLTKTPIFPVFFLTGECM